MLVSSHAVFVDLVIHKELGTNYVSKSYKTNWNTSLTGFRQFYRNSGLYWPFKGWRWWVNCCWSLPAQSFLVPSAAGLMTNLTVSRFLESCHCLLKIGFILNNIWKLSSYLDLGISWRWVVSFTPRQLYPLNRRLGGPQSQSGRHGEVKILLPPGLELRPVGRPTRNQLVYRLRYPELKPGRKGNVIELKSNIKNITWKLMPKNILWSNGNF
jgi:hypothetical protein